MIVVGKSPSRQMSNQNNEATLNKMVAHIEQFGPQSRDALARLVDDHIHGTKGRSGGDSFVRYCLKSGWLKDV